MVKKRGDSVDIDTKDAHHKTKDKSEDDVTHDKSNIIFMITIEFYLFVDKIEQGFPDNAYHNKIHVANVVQSMYILLTRGLGPKVAGDKEIMAGNMAMMREVMMCAKYSTVFKI